MTELFLNFPEINLRWLSIVLVAVCYTILFGEKMNRAVISLLIATFMILCGILTQTEAFQGIDFNTISLLIGMMIIVNITERSGLFQFVALWSAKKVRANPFGIMIMLGIVTAIFSAFLDNVTTVLLIVPVTFQITRKLEINPYPYLLLEIFASNIGGTATLIGDPPNILIGSALGLSFMDFIRTLMPFVAFVMIVLAVLFSFIWRRCLKTTDRNRAIVMMIDERESILDSKLLWQSLSVLLLVICGFISAEHIGIANGVIALCGAAVLLMLYTLQMSHQERESQTESILNLVDWTTIFFFCGLFMMVHGLEVQGILEDAGAYLLDLTKGNIQHTTFLVLGVSAAFSSVIDNIPFVATMIPMLKSMEASLGGREVMMPIWWALSLGACFGGNGTLIGASANVIVAGLAQREGRPIGFMRFLIWSVPVMLISILSAAVYLYLLYFMKA